MRRREWSVRGGNNMDGNGDDSITDDAGEKSW